MADGADPDNGHFLCDQSVQLRGRRGQNRPEQRGTGNSWKEKVRFMGRYLDVIGIDRLYAALPEI